MRLLSRLIVIFILALVVAGISDTNTGKVIFLISKYQIQLSTNLLFIILIIVFICLYYLLRLYINIKRIPYKINNFRFKNMLVSSKKYLNQAGVHFFEGKYRSCYDCAMKSVRKEPNDDNKFMAYLLAYKSASIMRDEQKIIALLDILNSFDEPKWMLSKYMAIAENYYSLQQYGMCIDNLNAVLKIDSRHVPAHFLLMKTYLYLKNYNKAYEMLDWLMKNDSIRDNKSIIYKHRIISGIFHESINLDTINKVYNKLEDKEKKSFQYAKLYFDALLKNKFYVEALHFIEVNQNESDMIQLLASDAILALSKILHQHQIITKAIIIAEGLLINVKNNPKLLMALGILNYKVKSWKQSQRYLEASVGLEKNIDGYLYLSMLAKEISDDELLSQCLKNMLSYLNRE